MIFSKSLRKYYSKRLALLLIFLYVGSVNAYNLFYAPPEGKLIRITDAEIYKPSQQFFEKVDVIEVTPTISSEIPKKEIPPLKERLSVEYTPLAEISIGDNPQTKESQNVVETILPLESPATKLTTQVIEQIKTAPDITNPPQLTTVPTQTSSQKPDSTPSTASSTSIKSTQQKIPPISASDVQQLADKFQLFNLKDGSVIELHITQSYSEVFTIYVQNGIVGVVEGESSNEDIELWLTHSAFEELLIANDISSTAKRLESEGKISAKQKASNWVLYRKGYKALAEQLGLM